MDTSVLLFETRAGRLTTPGGAWQFAMKVPRPPLDRWIGRLWELDGGCPPARERERPRGDISLIVDLEGRHAVVDATDPGREHVLDALHGAAARTLVDRPRADGSRRLS